MNDDTGFDEDDLLPSKTQLKRESEALQKIGEQLIALRQQDLDNMQLPEKLVEAVRVARKLNARGGLKRQKQYIGKIMREIDSEAVIKQLQHIQHRHDASNAAFKKTEHWRDRLIGEHSHQALTELLNQYPEMDRQHLNQLMRQAKKEATAGKPPTAARKLFKYVREFVDPEQVQNR